MSATDSFNICVMHSAFSSDKSVTWSNCVIGVDSNESIEYVKMPSKSSTVVCLVRVSVSNSPVEVESGKRWQAFSKPWDSDFYLYQKAFPETKCASMQL